MFGKIKININNESYSLKLTNNTFFNNDYTGKTKDFMNPDINFDLYYIFIYIIDCIFRIVFNY